MTHFHNTIASTGDTLVAHNITCKSQEDRILDIMKNVHAGAVSLNKEVDGYMTPFEVEKLYSKLYRAVPITSIRRAMSNLTEENKITKMNFMKSGEYGKPNFTWRYNESFGK